MNSSIDDVVASLAYLAVYGVQTIGLNFFKYNYILLSTKGTGSHVEYRTGMKNRNFVEDHPRNIPAKFGSNWPSGFGEEACVSENVISNFEDLNKKNYQNSFHSFLSQFFLNKRITLCFFASLHL
jgi:hypothetical protein